MAMAIEVENHCKKMYSVLPTDETGITGEFPCFTLLNDFDGDDRFKITADGQWITLEELKEVRKVVNRAIREFNQPL